MPVVVPGVLAREDPAAEPVPVVFDSPHSGTVYPADFGCVAPLALLRTAEDTYVEELYGMAPANGATLIHALFPRSYIDVNRDERDIDPALLAEPWPGELRPSRKTELGISLIRRLAVPGQPMYERKLSVAEVRRRIERYYRPYHAALDAALDDVQRRFGFALHVNCHSMKSTGSEMTEDGAAPRPDFVVSDRLGATSAPEFRDLVVERLRGCGYEVTVNDPYQGAELIRRHGRPAEGRHSLQIEINRRLYMDEASLERHAGFERLRGHLGKLVAAVCAYARQQTGACAGAGIPPS
jgi:N-formylglutamate amidohydrolase